MKKLFTFLALILVMKLLFERKFTYDNAGRPLTCDEGNGVIYKYYYR